MVDEPVATCGNCGELNSVTAAFCGTCGAQIVAVVPAPDDEILPEPTIAQPMMRSCRRCGAATPEGADYCFSCGFPANGVVPMASPPQDDRQRAAIISVSVFAALALIAGLVIWLLVRTPANDGSPIDGELADVVTSVDTGPLVTIATTVPPVTQVPATTLVTVPIDLTTTTLAAVATLPASTVSDTVATESTVPATTISATSVPETTAPPTTAPEPTSTTAVPTTTAPGEITGDLGIADHPITKPPCDDRYITIIASSISADTHEPGMTNALETYPDSEYLRTDQTCSSLRPDVDGEPIYVTYFGPFDDEVTACARRADGPDDAYVRVLSSTLPDDHQVSCD